MSSVVINFGIALGLSTGQIRSVEDLTSEELVVIRQTVKGCSEPGARKAALRHLAGGGSLGEFVSTWGVQMVRSPR